ncbi:MAG TPA: endonuclease domain-containing protein [Ramlibacter sp.]|nr:endonuclease domain-containing protein [Ramlibacter sp.]
MRSRPPARARILRKSPTDAENLLWYRLRNRHFLGLKFRRQRPIGKYIADFACVEIGLVIELDGGQHLEQAAHDRRRQAEMKELGCVTLRFWDREVLMEMEGVLERIGEVAEGLRADALTPTLSRRRERE